MYNVEIIVQAIQGVSEIGGNESRACYLDRKEKTSSNMCPMELCFHGMTTFSIGI